MSQEGDQGAFAPIEHVNPMFSSEYKPFGQDWLLGTGYNVLSSMMWQQMGRQGPAQFGPFRMPDSGMTPPESMYIQMRHGLDNIEQMRQTLVQDQSVRIYDQARLMAMSAGMPDLSRQLERASSIPAGQQLAWQMMANPMTSQALFGGQRSMAEAMTELAVGGTMMHRGLVPTIDPGETMMGSWGNRQARGFESGMGLLNAINDRMFGGGAAPMLPNTGYTSGWAPEEMYGLASSLIKSGNPAFAGKSGNIAPASVQAEYTGAMGGALAAGRLMFGDIGMPQMVQSAQTLMQQDIGSINPDEFKRHVERFAAITAALGASAGRMREIYFNMQQAVTAFQFDPSDPAGTRTTDMMGRPRLAAMTRGYTDQAFTMAGQMMAAGLDPVEAMQSTGQIMGRAQMSTMGGAIEMVQMMRAGGMITTEQARAFDEAVATGRTGAPTAQFKAIVDPIMGMDQAIQILRDPTKRNEWRSQMTELIQQQYQNEPGRADREIRAATEQAGGQMFQRARSEYIERRRDIMAGVEGGLAGGLASSLGVSSRSLLTDERRIEILRATAGDSTAEGIGIQAEIDRMSASGSSFGQIRAFLRDRLGGNAADVVTRAERAMQGEALTNATGMTGGPMGDIFGTLQAGDLFKGEAGGDAVIAIRDRLIAGKPEEARKRLDEYVGTLPQADQESARNLIGLETKRYEANVAGAKKQQEDMRGLRDTLKSGSPDVTVAFVKEVGILGGINFRQALENLEAGMNPAVGKVFAESQKMFGKGMQEALDETAEGKTLAGTVRGYLLNPTEWTKEGAGKLGLGEAELQGMVATLAATGDDDAAAVWKGFQGQKDKTLQGYLGDKQASGAIQQLKAEGMADRAEAKGVRAGGRAPMEVRLAPGTRLIIEEGGVKKMAVVPDAKSGGG